MGLLDLFTEMEWPMRVSRTNTPKAMAWRSISVVTALAAGLSWGAPPIAAEDSADDLARDLVSRFYDDLAPDNTALAGFLGEGFQIIGSDGLRFTRDTYLSFPKAITRYEISDLVAMREGDVLTATFQIGYTGAFEGAARTVPSLARLAVFHDTADGWKLQALAALGTGQNDVTAEAARVVGQWHAATESGDAEQIRALTAPDFQRQLPDGKGATLEDYLQAVEVPEGPSETEDVVATSFSDTMVTRYSLRTAVGDGAPASVSPRMTVFQRINGEWRVAADAIYPPLE